MHTQAEKIVTTLNLVFNEDYQNAYTLAPEHGCKISALDGGSFSVTHFKSGTSKVYDSPAKLKPALEMYPTAPLIERISAEVSGLLSPCPTCTSTELEACYQGLEDANNRYDTGFRVSCSCCGFNGPRRVRTAHAGQDWNSVAERQVSN